MNRPASNHHTHDEEIDGWIAEAGDFRVEPRPEHLEQVRLLLLDRVVLPPPPVPATEQEDVPTPLGIGLARIVAVACVLAAALSATVYLASRPSDSWATVAQALQDVTWIHVVETGPDGLREESWFSPSFEILAMTHNLGADRGIAEFHDLKMDTKTEYIPEENAIHRLAENEGTPRRQPPELEFFHHLRRGEDFKVSPLPGTEILGQTRREITEQGRNWKVYELTLSGKSGQGSPKIKVIMRVNPKTSLPHIWDIESEDGKISQTFDYPATGPADIMALGVPGDAKRVDHLPREDLNRVLEGLKAGRDRFDDYCAYVWFDKTVNRVWRKGRRWRVERGTPNPNTESRTSDPVEIPETADLAWWNEHEPLHFTPEAISDGDNIWIYRDRSKPSQGGQASSGEPVLVSTQRTFGTLNDSSIPWSHVQPEQVGRANVGLTDRYWELFLDISPKDGPPNTVRLRARDATLNDSKQPDIYRLWIDPEKNYLALRAETSVFKQSARFSGPVRSTTLDYIETRSCTELARSPNGFWYPKRVVRTTSNSKAEQITRFLLDFDRPIPDELFRPLP